MFYRASPVTDFAIRATLDISQWVLGKFFTGPTLPVKMHYVDWYPRTCQVLQDVAKIYWNRRLGGLMAALATTGSFFAVPYLPSKVSSVVPYTEGISSFLDPLIMRIRLVASIGLGTTFCTGTYDLIQKYLMCGSAEVKPVFPSDLQKDIDDLTDIIAVWRNQGNIPLPNILLSGPPGTGKTMLGKWIATHSNMNYIHVSGADLLNLSPEELTYLFEHARNQTSPTLLFMDEANAFFANPKDEKKLALLDVFLEKTGADDSKLMVILATNHPEKLHPAVISRMGWKWPIPKPDLETRKKIIQMHLPIFFTEQECKDIFSETILNQIAETTSELSGRSLSKMLHHLVIVSRSRKEKLTTDTIARIVHRFINQEKQSEQLVRDLASQGTLPKQPNLAG